jgi:hypothetical protein
MVGVIVPTFEHVLGWSGQWLKLVKVEQDTPDLWELARQQRAWLISDEKSFGANTPFSPPERDQIRLHLRTIAEHAVKTYQLTEAAQVEVRERLNYLEAAADRVGRLDWKNLAASTFIGIVLNLSLSVEQGGKLLTFANQLLGPLVAGAARLLQ